MARLFKDDRGRSINNAFPSVQNGDINISTLYPRTIKAFHRHKLQTDHWLCIKGQLRVVLASLEGDERDTGYQIYVHYLSEGDTLSIPPGVWHGVQNLLDEESIMAYHITEKYNPSNPDEERAPWDQFYNWERSKK